MLDPRKFGFSFALIIFSLPSLELNASSFDYIYPYSSSSFSNYGSLGLLNTPNARFLKEGSLAFSWIGMDPYLRGSIVAYPFNWFEASFGYTDINNQLYSEFSDFSGTQSLKDKGFNLKIRLIEESKLLPQVAIGLRDMAGTGLFSSEFLVFSKWIGDMDFSLGFGWGMLSGNNFTNPLGKIHPTFYTRETLDGSQGGQFQFKSFFSGDIGIFGGIEYRVPRFKGLRVKIELDGIDYSKEANNSLDQESNFNLGISYPINDLIDLNLGIVRGNTINFGFSMKGNFFNKNSFIKKYEKPIKIQNSDVIKRINSRNENRFLYLTSLKYLNAADLFLQTATLEDNNKIYKVAYTQNKHTSYVRAAGRVARILDQISPNSIEEFQIMNLNADMGLHTVTINRQKFQKQEDNLLWGITIDPQSFSNETYNKTNYEFQPKEDLPKHIYKIAPSLRSQIGGPDGFFFGDLRMSFKSEILFQKNLTLTSLASVGIIDNLNNLKLESESVLPHVRTDIVDYLKEGSDYSIDLFQLNYFKNPHKNLYTKISVGIFESMFGGSGAEVLYRPFLQNWAFGLEAYRVKQRDYDQLFKFQKYDTTTAFANFFYYHEPSSVLLRVKGGKFLAKDSGIKFEFSRIFKSGLRMGVFATLTDISTEEFGEGSFDKGFYFFIPIESFFTGYSKGFTGFGLRPITRDGGADLNMQYDLWSVTDQGSAYNLTRNWEDLYD